MALCPLCHLHLLITSIPEPGAFRWPDWVVFSAGANPIHGVAAGCFFASISAAVDLSGQQLQPDKFQGKMPYGNAVKLE